MSPNDPFQFGLITSPTTFDHTDFYKKVRDKFLIDETAFGNLCVRSALEYKEHFLLQQSA